MVKKLIGMEMDSGAVGLHTPNLTDDVFTLVVPTCNPLRQATDVLEMVIQ